MMLLSRYGLGRKNPFAECSDHEYITQYYIKSRLFAVAVEKLVGVNRRVRLRHRRIWVDPH